MHIEGITGKYFIYDSSNTFGVFLIATSRDDPQNILQEIIERPDAHNTYVCIRKYILNKWKKSLGQIHVTEELCLKETYVSNQIPSQTY